MKIIAYFKEGRSERNHFAWDNFVFKKTLETKISLLNMNILY